MTQRQWAGLRQIFATIPVVFLAACEQAPPPSQTVEQAYAQAMRAPLAQSAASVSQVFPEPGQYSLRARVEATAFEGMTSSNRSVAEKHFGSLGTTQIDMCVSQEQIDGGVASMLQLFSVPGCEMDAKRGSGGRARSGAVCEGPGGTNYLVANATERPDRLEVREFKPDGGQGYAVIDWSVAVERKGSCTDGSTISEAS